ncbi:MAG: 2-oxoacid:ferredoxin oxidoreductase subunit beta [Gemmataceae bacterium]|nr:2-oxoacid:ferredoxin oxidoreductase subunit beta [Gemmataceae bacterium]
MNELSLPMLAPEDFDTDQEVRWCPGCGDYSVLAQMKQVLAGTGVPREKIVIVSGIGCAGRVTYYLDAYGFHGVHGRAPAFATGIKLANPDLQVWVVLGDGDGLSAGANHLLHALRRNVDLKIVLVNNEVLGLARGQYSSTSRLGTRTKTSPEGSFETPLRAISVALAAEATFVARTLDVEANHLAETLRRAAAHKGGAFVEIYQNCKIYNDGVFEFATDRSTKADAAIFLEQGRPLLFGKDRNQGIRLSGFDPEVVEMNGAVPIDDLIMHDEKAEQPTLAFVLSRLTGPEFPECFGVFRNVSRPSFDEQVMGRITAAKKAGTPSLQALLDGDEAWTAE